MVARTYALVKTTFILHFPPGSSQQLFPGTAQNDLPSVWENSGGADNLKGDISNVPAHSQKESSPGRGNT